MPTRLTSTKLRLSTGMRFATSTAASEVFDVDQEEAAYRFLRLGKRPVRD